MSDSDHNELLSEFTTITGTSEDRAKFYLESANWNLQIALSSFYETNQDADMDLVNAADTIDDDGDDESNVAVGGSASSSFPAHFVTDKKEKKQKSKNRAVGGGRVFTLNNMSSSEDDDEDNTGQAFYAGGSERSGQQVLGPPRKNASKDFVSNIFKSAKESGAEIVENPSASRPTTSGSFSGTGYRLGQTNDDHVRLTDATRSTSRDSAEPIILRLWRQGFTINDNEIRLYEDQKNREFLEYITKGQLPPELRQQGTMVQVNMEDHRHEDYKQQAAKTKPFSGKGHTLGSPTPNIGDGATSIATIPLATSATDNETNEKLANEKLKVDEAQPTTTIQIRLADGSRLSGRFNMAHTINDIRTYITNARPQYGMQSFALLSTFPSKELADSEQTVEAAGIANAAILQRLK